MSVHQTPAPSTPFPVVLTNSNYPSCFLPTPLSTINAYPQTLTHPPFQAPAPAPATAPAPHLTLPSHTHISLIQPPTPPSPPDSIIHRPLQQYQQPCSTEGQKEPRYHISRRHAPYGHGLKIESLWVEVVVEGLADAVFVGEIGSVRRAGIGAAGGKSSQCVGCG